MAKGPAFHFEIQKSPKDQKYYWHLVSAKNGRVVADSGEGYDRHEDCKDGLEMVREWASKAPIFDYSKGKLEILFLGDWTAFFDVGELASRREPVRPFPKQA